VIATAVYVLCGLTSAACALLLLRAYGRRGARLLLWSGLGFVGFAVGNLMLVVDLVILPDRDLVLMRSVPVLAGLAVLIYGLVWDTQ
jgi:hypothetical protein